MKINKDSIGFKLSIRSSMFLCIAFVLLFGVICILNTEIIYNKEEQVFTSYLVNTMTSIDDKLKDMSRVSLMSMADDRTQEVLLSYQDMDDEEKREQQAYLSEFYQSLVTIRNDIHGIYMMDLDNLLFYYDIENPTLKEGVDAVEMAQEIISLEKEPMQISNCSLVVDSKPQFMKYSGYYATDPYYANCLWLVRDIYGFSPHEKIGTIALTVPIAKIQELLENTLHEDMFYLLINRSGKIVCSQNNQYLLEQVEDVNLQLSELMDETGTNTIEWEGTKSFVMHMKSEDSGLTLLVGKPVQVIQSEITGFMGYYILLCACVLVLILTVTAFNVNRMLMPIKNLANDMGHFNSDSIAVRYKVESKDETGQLISAFNNMMDMLEELIEKQYKDRVRIQEGQIKEQNLSMLYLKSQVNPHFLYNTLDTIRIHAQMNGDKDVSNMLMQLVEFFRLSVKVDKAVVTLEHEVDLIENYLALMCRRYPDIHCIYDIEPELLDIEVPNFILQPIVENSILHGLRDKGYNGNLKITIRYKKEDDKYIEILITDDGVGFSEESRKKVQKLLDDTDAEMTAMHSIGIRNIQNRLHMFYPKECGLSYREERCGVTACILILDKMVGSNTEVME
ncbi:MAG: histidine kinase [Lachnospiraceae bacterium]|nr:histidine kinase [Lachnospiraceae bacterium]